MSPIALWPGGPSLPLIPIPPRIPQGREVVQLLGAARPGQWTGEVLARVVEWQLAHPAPEGTKEAAEAWLRAEHAAGRVSTENASVAGKRGKDAGADGKAKKAKR